MGLAGLEPAVREARASKTPPFMNTTAERTERMRVRPATATHYRPTAI
jgi:hypothetical protein